MSKKSRRRNKKILAAIGLGLGAMALSKRKSKSDLASTEDGKSGSTKITGGTNLNDYDAGTKKEEKKSKFERPIGKPGPARKRFPQDTKVGTKENNYLGKGKGYATKKGNSRGDFGTTGKPEKKDYFGATLFPKSQAADNFKADNREYKGANQSYEGRKSGGRAGYKSGGKVKGCGKALRGFGKAMKGNR